MALAFKKATKDQSKVRAIITGPTGGGKTYTALSIAQHLGQRVALIDTEHGSASLYSDDFDFDVVELTENYHPSKYAELIRLAANSGYEVCIIDSMTHAWQGKGGVLEIAGGKFTNWKDARPAHELLINPLVSMRQRMHIIATARSAMDHVVGPDGKTPIKLGMEAKQDKDLAFEFDLQIEMDHQHNGAIGKTRFKVLDGKSFYMPGKDVADLIKTSLASERDVVIVALGRVAAQLGEFEAIENPDFDNLSVDQLREIGRDMKQRLADHKLHATEEVAPEEVPA